MLFGKFGTVVEAEIIYNDKGSKGFGFVTMSRGKDADYALRKLNHAIVEGRVIEVSVCLSPVCPRLHVTSLFRSTWPLPRSKGSRSRPPELLLGSSTPTAPSALSRPPSLWLRRRPDLPRPSWRFSRSVRRCVTWTLIEHWFLSYINAAQFSLYSTVVKSKAFKICKKFSEPDYEYENDSFK